MATRGGKRPGSGRKPGPTAKPFRDYVSEKDKATFVEFMLSNYMADMRLATWVGDQLFGKAAQAITGPDGGPVEITVIKYAGNKPSA